AAHCVLHSFPTRRSSDLVQLDAEEHHIWADAVRIQQVFWNLINNAVKFTPPGGKIDIRTSNDDYGRFQFQITDNGIGIEVERQRSEEHTSELQSRFDLVC